MPKATPAAPAATEETPPTPPSEGETPPAAPTPPAGKAKKPAPEGAPPGDGQPTATPEGEPPATPEPDMRAIRASFADQGRIRKEERRLAAERQALQEADRQRQAELRQLQSQVTALTANLERAKRDPISWAKENGTNPDDIIKGFIESDTPEAKLAELQRQVEEKFKAIEGRERDLLQWREQQQENHQLNVLTHAVVTDPQRFRYLNIRHEGAEIFEQIRGLHEWAKSQGQAYSAEDCLNYLEDRAKTRYQEDRAREQRLLGSESEGGEQPPSPPAPHGNDPRATNGSGTSAGRVLAGKTSGRVSPPKDPNPEAVDDWALSQLREAKRKDSQRA
jgi:hypothetical protein